MFSALTLSYLFLGGTGAGAIAILSCLQIRPKNAPENVLTFSWCAGCLCLLFGSICLLADAGRPDRLLNLFTMPQMTVLSLGSFALFGSLICSIFFMLYHLMSHPTFPHWFFVALSLISCFTALITTIYTGVLLQTFASVKIYQTWLLPVLFMVSSLSSGIGIILLGCVFNSSRFSSLDLTQLLMKIDSLLIALELIVTIAFCLVAAHWEDAQLGIQNLIRGNLSCVFWIGFIGFGMLYPIILHGLAYWRNRRCAELRPFSWSTLWLTSLALALLVGCFSLRYCITEVSSYDLTQMPDMLYGIEVPEEE